MLPHAAKRMQRAQHATISNCNARFRTMSLQAKSTSGAQQSNSFSVKGTKNDFHRRSVSRHEQKQAEDRFASQRYALQ